MSKLEKVQPTGSCHRLQVSAADFSKIKKIDHNRMLFLLHLIREFEDKLLELKDANLVHGPVHSSIGQEANAAAAAEAAADEAAAAAEAANGAAAGDDVDAAAHVGAAVGHGVVLTVVTVKYQQPGIDPVALQAHAAAGRPDLYQRQLEHAPERDGHRGPAMKLGADADRC